MRYFQIPLAAGRRAALLAATLGFACWGLTSCSRFERRPAADYVYVTAKQAYLRDRTAAVSNRIAMVQNGQRLRVLEQSRHWLRVSTDHAETGWIDDKAVVSQKVYQQFAAMQAQHKQDPAVAMATVRDEVNLHVTPGRGTEHFYRLEENDKLQMLQRATLPRTGVQARPQLETASTKSAPAVAEPPPMEDWWLVRDKKGETGWVLSRMIDVDSPDALLRYSEGQRIVGAYVLTTVNDPDAPQDNKDVPVYVAVLAPFKAGLPYDFDQVRVFTWNKAKHRYETAFREKNIEGYLPVTIGSAKDLAEKGSMGEMSLPSFSYKVLSGDAPEVTPDVETGVITPGATITKTYRLEGNIVRRVEPPGSGPVNEAHPASEKKEEKKRRR